MGGADRPPVPADAQVAEGLTDPHRPDILARATAEEIRAAELLGGVLLAIVAAAIVVMALLFVERMRPI